MSEKDTDRFMQNEYVNVFKYKSIYETLDEKPKFDINEIHNTIMYYYINENINIRI